MAQSTHSLGGKICLPSVLLLLFLLVSGCAMSREGRGDLTKFLEKELRNSGFSPVLVDNYPSLEACWKYTEDGYYRHLEVSGLTLSQLCSLLELMIGEPSIKFDEQRGVFAVLYSEPTFLLCGRNGARLSISWAVMPQSGTSQ